jgi:hypothetical protein
MKVMSLVPSDIPVTNPAEVIVATAGVLDVQGVVASAVALPIKAVVLPIQTASVPVIIGNGLTVTVAVCTHPFVFMKVMSLVPLDIPVTNPAEVIVATAGVLDVQGVVASAVALPIKVVVLPIQTARVPVIVGNGLTVTVTVCAQPLVFIYVITLVPKDTAVTKPVDEIVATPIEVDIQGVVV